MRYPNFHEVLRLDRVVKSRSNRDNVVTHQLRNRAGTVFEITTKAYKRYGARQARYCETVFLIADHPYGNKTNKHGTLTPDILCEIVPYGMLSLPRFSPIWDEPRENFTRATLVTTIQRGLHLVGTNSTLQLYKPPEHLASFIDLYTSFGCVAYDDVSAMMLKIAAPVCGQGILREGL